MVGEGSAFCPCPIRIYWGFPGALWESIGFLRIHDNGDSRDSFKILGVSWGLFSGFFTTVYKVSEVPRPLQLILRLFARLVQPPLYRELSQCHAWAVWSTFIFLDIWNRIRIFGINEIPSESLEFFKFHQNLWDSCTYFLIRIPIRILIRIR